MVFEQKTGRVSGLCESPIGNREINVVRSFFGKTCAVHNVHYNWKYWDIKGKVVQIIRGLYTSMTSPLASHAENHEVGT